MTSMVLCQSMPSTTPKIRPSTTIDTATRMTHTKTIKAGSTTTKKSITTTTTTTTEETTEEETTEEEPEEPETTEEAEAETEETTTVLTTTKASTKASPTTPTTTTGKSATTMATSIVTTQKVTTTPTSTTVPKITTIATTTPEPIPEQNNCLCVPISSCVAILGGNSTVEETDGSGIIQGRIINSQMMNYSSYNIASNTTSPINSGIPLITSSPTTCQNPSLLELCCPAKGYQCGRSYPPVKGAPSAKAASLYGQFPWQAMIFTSTQFYVGSGVLIDQFHILSVPHRFSKFNLATTQFVARLGEWNTASSKEPLPYREFNISKLFRNPNFNSSNLRNDIMVLRLATRVPLGMYPTIATACLPSKPILPPARCWISGWGNQDPTIGSLQSTQLAIDVSLVDFETCQTLMKKTTALGPRFVLDPGFLCAGGETGKDACFGDGGSPLAFSNSRELRIPETGTGTGMSDREIFSSKVCSVQNQWYVVGLVAWGISCGGNVPGVYMNVSRYINWIQNVTISP
ncbi:hypothetical protein PVAND_014553 [Polypedilum vanderplanki]|uniref:Peptidase S1 domain-containing protein n=1 Tax=Polypedilum vanderplanki TaxID=319348 RepID=A0A9J6BA19_POLVA|nr:hypothetical protein PVAND_014553 [Polypedilum vanderplanki]